MVKLEASMKSGHGEPVEPWLVNGKTIVQILILLLLFTPSISSAAWTDIFGKSAKDAVKATENDGKATVNFIVVETAAETGDSISGTIGASTIVEVLVASSCTGGSVSSRRDSDGDGVVDRDDLCSEVNDATIGDNDRDGIGNLCDLCPEGEFPRGAAVSRAYEPGPGVSESAWFGCPMPKECIGDDEDGDGFGDVLEITIEGKRVPCDICPGTKNTKQRDSDGDGIGDACDNCRFVAVDAEHRQGDPDRDGYGATCDNCDEVDNSCQEDRDEDRVGDVCDNCPDVPNGKGLRAIDNQADSDDDEVGDACDDAPGGADPGCAYFTEGTCVPNADPTDTDCDMVRDTMECDICPTNREDGGAFGCPETCVLARADATRDKNSNLVDDRCEPCVDGAFQFCKTTDGKDGCQGCVVRHWGSCGSDPGLLAHCPQPDDECEEGETTSKGCETVRVGLCEEAIKKCQPDGTWGKDCGTRPIERCDDKCAMPDVQDDVVHELDPDMDGLLNYAWYGERNSDGSLVVVPCIDRNTGKPVVATVDGKKDGDPCDPCPNTPPAISEHPPFTPGAWHVPGPGGLKVPGVLGGTSFGDLAGKVTIVPTERGGTRVIKLPLADSARRSLLEDVTKFMTRLGDPQGRPGKDGYDYDNDGDGKNDSCKEEKPPKDKLCEGTEYRNTELEKLVSSQVDKGLITREEAAVILSEDKDQDGIPAWCDNCPEKFNTGQGKYDCPDIPPVDAGCPSDYLKPKEPTGGEKPKRPERPTRPAKCDDLEKELNYEREDLFGELESLERTDPNYAGELLIIHHKLSALKLPAECQAPTGGIEGPAKITGTALVEVLAGKLGSAPATTENMAKAAEEFVKRRGFDLGAVGGIVVEGPYKGPYAPRPVTNKDSDGDGYYDFCDNCPYVPNKDQADRDGDGVGDSCDNCPYAPNPKQESADGDEFGDICDPGDDDGDGKCDTCCVSCCCQGPACLPQDCFVEEAGSQRDPDGDGRDNFKIIDGFECDACPLADNGMDADHDGTPDGCDPCPNAYDRVHADADQDGIPNVCDNCMDDRNIDQTDDDDDGYGNACDTLVGPGPGPDPLPPPPFTCPEGQIASDSDGDGVMDTCSTIEGEGSVSKADCADAGGTVNPWGAEELRDRIGHYLSIKEMREVCLGHRTLEDQTTHQPIGDVVCDENGNIIGDCAKGSTKLTGEGCGCTLRGKGLTHPETLVNIFVWMLMVIFPAVLIRRSGMSLRALRLRSGQA